MGGASAALTREVHQQRLDDAETLAATSRAIAIDSNSHYALILRGGLHYRSKDLPAALQDFRAAAKGGHPLALLNVANTLGDIYRCHRRLLLMIM